MSLSVADETETRWHGLRARIGNRPRLVLVCVRVCVVPACVRWSRSLDVIQSCRIRREGVAQARDAGWEADRAPCSPSSSALRASGWITVRRGYETLATSAGPSSAHAGPRLVIGLATREMAEPGAVRVSSLNGQSESKSCILTLNTWPGGIWASRLALMV